MIIKVLPIAPIVIKGGNIICLCSFTIRAGKSFYACFGAGGSFGFYAIVPTVILCFDFTTFGIITGAGMRSAVFIVYPITEIAGVRIILRGSIEVYASLRIVGIIVFFTGTFIVNPFSTFQLVIVSCNKSDRAIIISQAKLRHLTLVIQDPHDIVEGIKYSHAALFTDIRERQRIGLSIFICIYLCIHIAIDVRVVFIAAVVENNTPMAGITKIINTLLVHSLNRTHTRRGEEVVGNRKLLYTFGMVWHHAVLPIRMPIRIVILGKVHVHHLKLRGLLGFLMGKRSVGIYRDLGCVDAAIAIKHIG